MQTLLCQLVRPFQAQDPCVPLGLLLRGPPGSGKSFLAAALAAELPARLLAAGSADLLAARVGDGEKAVAKLFGAARAATSAELLEDIDELADSPETCAPWRV